MNTSGIQRLVIPNLGNTNPFARNTIIIPLEKTSTGWIIQLNGKKVHALTDLKLEPGVPLKGVLTPKNGGLEFTLTPGKSTLPLDNPIIAQLVSQGAALIPERIERLQKYWNRAPGSTDREKAKILLLLDEKNLLSPELLEDLGLVFGREFTPDKEHPSPQFQDHSNKKSKEAEPENLEEIKINPQEKPGMAVDLFSIPQATEPFWVIIPFAWQTEGSQVSGISRFLWDPKSQQVKKWTFGLKDKDLSFHFDEGKTGELQIFGKENFDAKELISKLNPLMSQYKVSFHTTENFDGFEAINKVKLKSVDEHA